MSKVKGGLFGFGATGKLANEFIYQKWGPLNIVRKKVDPSNPSTTKQQTERGFYGVAIGYWRGGLLTPDDIDAWVRLAKFKKFKFTTYNFYVKRMLQLQQAGATNPFYWNSEAYYHDVTWDYFELEGADEEDDLGVWIGSTPATMDRFISATWYGDHYWTRDDQLVEGELNYYQWGNSGGGDMRTGIYTYTRITP